MGFLDKLFGKKEEPKMELAAPLAGEAVSNFSGKRSYFQR